MADRNSEGRRSIFVDHHNSAIYEIDSEDDGSYEAEEDIAYTVTEVSRKRRKQRHQAVLRLLAFFLILLMIIAIGLGIYFTSARRVKEQGASMSSDTTSNEAPADAANPQPQTELPLKERPKSPSNSPAVASNHDDIPEAMDFDLANICSSPEQNQEICKAECSKGKCCWDTNTCVYNEQCSSYAPCLNLKNTTEIDVISMIDISETNTPPILNDTEWNLITYDEFEKGWGNFKDGGTDSKLITYGDAGNMVADIRNNNKESILPLKEPKDVSQYSALRVKFIVVAHGLEIGDTMQLEYSPDGGANWEIVKGWSFITDDNFLMNDTPYQHNATFYSTDYFFSKNAMIRFRSDANSSNDHFYIDNVMFEGSAVVSSDSGKVAGNAPPTSISNASTTVQEDTIWNRITFDDFESGWGNFKDGGSDSLIQTLPNGNLENHVVRIRDDSQESILPLKEPQDVTQYKALRVSFWLETDGLDPGDMLLLEYSSEGGSSWEIVKEWVFGLDGNFQENGTPYQFNVTFYSTDYVFSNKAMIRFRSDSNSDADAVYVDNVQFEGSEKIDGNGNDINANKFYSFCGARSKENVSMVTCNPASIACNSDVDCFENFVASLETATKSCNNDPECIKQAHAKITSVEYVQCLPECDQPTAVTAVGSQQWEIITSDNFHDGYGNFVDKGSYSKITTFVSNGNITSNMVELRADKKSTSAVSINASLPLRDYYNVKKYVALVVNLQLVFQGVEAGDTLILEYSSEPSSWVIVEEWVFGGAVINEINVPYTEDAMFYNNAYTNFTTEARIRFRSLANSGNDHFLIGDIVFSGLKK